MIAESLVLAAQQFREARAFATDGLNASSESLSASLEAFDKLVQHLRHADDCDRLRAPLRAMARSCSTDDWLQVLVEVPDGVSRWVLSAVAAGIPFIDGLSRYRSQFRPLGGFCPGLTLARFGLVPILVPPSTALLEWLAGSTGVAGLYDGKAVVSIPTPNVVPDKGDRWDGHELLLGRRDGKYPRWYSSRSAGKGIRIAVLDTGIANTHKAFRGRIIGQADFTGDGLGDRFGHGTHCAGIAAGGQYGSGRFHGVAPAANLLDVKVLGDHGSGTTSGILMGLEWARRRGAHVISMSFGNSGRSNGHSILSRAVERLVQDEGIFVAVSAGNRGPAGGSITVPGDAPHCCTAAAIDRNCRVATFSSRGPTSHSDTSLQAKPDLCAPGCAVVGPAAPNSRFYGGTDSDHVVSLSGTSMAAPAIAGIAAVLLALAPRRKRVPTLIKEAMMRSTLPVEGPCANDKNAAGYGIISADRVVRENALFSPWQRLGRTAAAAVIGALLVTSVLAATNASRRNESALTGFSDDPSGGHTFANATVNAHSRGVSVRRTQSFADSVGLLRKPACYVFDPDRQLLLLRVHRGMTLTDLSTHFGLGISQILKENPQVRGDMLLAGHYYRFSTSHLGAKRHVVNRGDTLFSLVRRYGLRSRFSIRAWNCLDDNLIRVGETLLIFQPY